MIDDDDDVGCWICVLCSVFIVHIMIKEMENKKRENWKSGIHAAAKVAVKIVTYPIGLGF